MPTQRAHGGAALTHIPMVVPGFMGLNTEQASGLLGPEWATVLTNAVIDANGRVAARKGVARSFGGPTIAEQFTNFVELVKSNGNTSLVGHAGDTFYTSSDNGSTWSDITGTATPDPLEVTAFHNFNDNVVALQPGQPPAVSPGTSFVSVTDVNAPTGGIGCSAFGRMWIADADGHTLKYSALLDATDWTSTDSGYLDMWSVWPGNDTITAVTQFNGALVVFGRKCVIVWTDGAGSALGIDPINMYVVDIVHGVGCISQFSVQHVDGDLWFLSEYGLQSFGRLIQEKSNPIENLSKNVQGLLQAAVEQVPESNIRSAYSPRERVFLLSLSSGGTAETGRCYVFDTRQKLPDGAARCVGSWTMVPTALTVRRDGSIGVQVLEDGANYGVYSGQLDNTLPYLFDYESGWMDLTQQGYLIFPKRYSGVFWSDNDITINFKYALDFSDSFVTRSRSFVGAGAGAEWGTGEWNEGEFGGGVSLHSGQVTGARSGEYIKLGITCNVNNTVMAVQQLDLFCKVGRIA